MKGNKGITLIALIITIIVLLILAGVTIAMLMGDHGILTQTDAAKVTTIEGEVKEAVKLAMQTERLRIANEAATDASYNAATHTANCGDVVEGLGVDLTADRGYTITGGTDTVTVVYTTDRYKDATNYDGAKMTFTINVGQQSLTYNEPEIVNEAP